MALQIPSTGAFIAVDTSTTSKTIQLPLTGERQGRVITIKDRTGQANKNPIIIQTTGQETFQDSSTSYKLSGSFDSVTFIANSGKWLLFSNSSEFPSTIQGLGTLGFISSGTVNVISTAQLTSTIQGLGTLGYLSSAITNLSSIISTPQLTSSIEGLGTLGYLSTPSLISTVASMSDHFKILSASVSSLNASNIYSVQGYISSLQVDSLQIGTGTGWVDFGAIQAVIVSTLEINSGIIYGTTISSGRFVGDGSLLSNLTIPSVTPQLTSSLVGLGSMGYISSAQLISTTEGLTTYINSFIDPQELASSITGLGSVQFISSIGLLSTSQGLANYITSFIDPLELSSTVTGLGSAQYVSTTVTATNLIFTSSLVGLGSMGYLSSAITNLSSIISTPQLTSSLVGLGSMGYLSSLALSSIISTPQLTSSLVGLGSMGYLSSLRLSSIISTPQLTSSLVGLGSMGYVSSLSSVGNNFSSFSTSLALSFRTQTGSISSLTVSSLSFGSGNGYINFPDLRATSLSTLILSVSSINNQPLFTISVVESTLRGLGTLGYLSSAITNLSSIISTPQLTSSLQGLGSMGYLSSVPSTFISSAALFSSLQGLGSMGYLSSLRLSSIISTPQLTSSLQGLGTLGYLSSVPSTFISSATLFSTIQGLGSLSYISSVQLISTSQGLTDYINSFFASETFIVDM